MAGMMETWSFDLSRRAMNCSPGEQFDAVKIVASNRAKVERSKYNLLLKQLNSNCKIKNYISYNLTIIIYLLEPGETVIFVSPRQCC